MTEFNNMTEQERIDWAKDNWTAWGGLSSEQKKWFKAHGNKTLWLDNTGGTHTVGPVLFEDIDDLPGIVLQLRPDYKAPAPAPDWVYHDVVIQGGTYIVEGRASLAMAANEVSFGGVQFEDQDEPDEWWYATRMFIDDNGRLYLFDNDGLNYRPAVPVRARFRK